MNEQPNEQPNEQEQDLQSFLTMLSAVALDGGDVIATIQRNDVPKPLAVQAVNDGASGQTIWSRNQIG